jgi:hypothetical protein
MKVAAGRSYTSPESDEEGDVDEEGDMDEEGDVDDEELRDKSSGDTDEEDDTDAEEMEESDSDADVDALLAGTVPIDENVPPASTSSSNIIREFLPGSYVIARYDSDWYIAQVENEQANILPGYTRLRYMAKKGRNRFMWEKPDILSTLDQDILLKTPPPVPVTSRFMGVSENIAKQADRLLLVHVVLIFLLFLLQSISGTGSVLLLVSYESNFYSFLAKILV